MPRRHRRDDEPEPLSITAADIPKPRRPETPEEREARLERRAEYRRKQEAAARRKRIQEAIRWDMCMVPGCLAKQRPPYNRDVDERLPICYYHATIVKRELDGIWDDAEVREQRKAVQAHRDQVMDGMDRTLIIAHNNGGSRQGQIYFLRANGLVKVGWSSDLVQRLKAYGPDVEILCHYPGSRQDETLMHRQLRPYLAKGREWYQDCRLIADVVAGIVKQHGEPYLSAAWTEPKPEPIKRRRSA